MRYPFLKLVTTLAVSAWLAPAFAADLPVKAPPMMVYQPSGNFYFGFGTEAAVAQANVSGNNLFATSLVNGDLKAAGGAVCGVAGYISGDPNRWWRLEASGCYQNITGGTPIAGANASVASRWSASQEVDIGFELIQRIFAAVGNLGVAFPTFQPNLPSNVAVAASPRQYVGVGFREFGVDGSFGAASGTSWSAAPMVKTGYLWQTLDANGRLNGGAIDVYAWASFPMRGITIGNAFAANGTPLTFGAGANMGTQYGAGIRYDFSLNSAGRLGL